MLSMISHTNSYLKNPLNFMLNIKKSHVFGCILVEISKDRE